MSKHPFIAVIYTLLGIVGAITVFFGFFQPNSQTYYLVGSSLLLATAIYYQLVYFIALELIIIAGHGAIVLGIGSIIQLTLPILLCLQLFIYYLLSKQLDSPFRVIGIVGIALISIGLSYGNDWLLLSGAICVVMFACYDVSQGKKIALLWAILNSSFVVGIAYPLLTNWLFDQTAR